MRRAVAEVETICPVDGFRLSKRVGDIELLRRVQQHCLHDLVVVAIPVGDIPASLIYHLRVDVMLPVYVLLKERNRSGDVCGGKFRASPRPIGHPPTWRNEWRNRDVSAWRN